MNRLIIYNDGEISSKRDIVVMPDFFRITVECNDIDSFNVKFHKDGETLLEFILGTDSEAFRTYSDETFKAITPKVMDFVMRVIAEDISLFMNQNLIHDEDIDNNFQAKAMDIEVIYDKWSIMLKTKIEELAYKTEKGK